MIKVSVMYPNGEGHTFDMTYYMEKHVPLVRQELGEAIKGVAVDEGLASAAPGSRPAYLVLGHFLFDSVEAFQGSFAQHGQALLRDIPNFTNTVPTIQISEVKI